MEAIMEVIQLELKYCERCGSLWVRETGSGEIFCFPCVLKMQDCPGRVDPGSRGGWEGIIEWILKPAVCIWCRYAAKEEPHDYSCSAVRNCWGDYSSTP